MAARFGPPALPTLTVAPVPGRFGQGFPGLIYLSTMAYLAPENKADPVAGRAWAALLLGYSAGARDRAPVVGQRGDVGGLSRRVADGGAGGLLGAALPGEQERLAAGGAGAGFVQDQPAADGERAYRGIGGADRAGHAAGGSQTPTAYYNITYGKGSWIMHMLRRRMGDERFLAMLADLRKGV